MRIKSLKLENFRKFENRTLDFPYENQIILIGNNGSGKTSILDAIAKCFAHFIGVLSTNRDDGSYKITDYLNLTDIKNGKNQAKISCENDSVTMPKIEVFRRIDETASHYGYTKEELERLRELIIHDKIDSLPLMVYYRVNRTTLQSENNINSKAEKFYKPILNGYSNCLSPQKSAFTDFDSWFIEKENVENEEIRRRKDFEFQLPELKVLREVLKEYIGALYKVENPRLSVSRRSVDDAGVFLKEGKILLEYGENRVMLSQLSSGEKSIFYIIADIARRLLILNKGNADFKNHIGVVLIDEIDLHLHPKWQREILSTLSSVFPKIQFICTTHSPQVLSSVTKNKVVEIDDEFYPLSSDPLGGESGRILEEVFDTPKRPGKVERLISEIFKHLDADFLEMKKINDLIDDLHKLVSPEDPIFIKIENYLERRKLLSE